MNNLITCYPGQKLMLLNQIPNLNLNLNFESDGCTE